MAEPAPHAQPSLFSLVEFQRPPDHGVHRLDLVRGPDLAFVSRERIRSFPPRSPIDGAPDLAVEMVSPSNKASEIQEKVLDHLDAGARMVWLVDPAPRTVTVYRSRNAIRLLPVTEELEGGELLAGFRVPAAAGPPLPAVKSRVRVR